MGTILDEIQRVFFKGMAEGWAQNMEKVAVPGLPGYKKITHVFGDYEVTDCYCVNQSSKKSTGFTTIAFQNDPVWVMHYGGWYPKHVIPFLKTCLQKAYVDEKCFHGGRGPELVLGEQFKYVNWIGRNHFHDFEGEEKVIDLDDNELGSHWYRGMSLL